jgi:hypothetical protein
LKAVYFKGIIIKAPNINILIKGWFLQKLKLHNMNQKYLVLYLIAATLALLLVIYQGITTYPSINYSRLGLNVIISLFFYYLAYKTYHEKKDQELM